MASSGSFRFLDLPSELQLIILEYAVVQPAPILLTIDAAAPRLSKAVRYMAAPPLLRVSQLIRRDALKIHFSMNTFRSACDDQTPKRHNCRVLIEWLCRVPRTELRLIRLIIAHDPKVGWNLGIGFDQLIRTYAIESLVSSVSSGLNPVGTNPTPTHVEVIVEALPSDGRRARRDTCSYNGRGDPVPFFTYFFSTNADHVPTTELSGELAFPGGPPTYSIHFGVETESVRIVSADNVDQADLEDVMDENW
ncbi:hypothetical protein B0A48_03816 [Cryoendolithus antarcticus]|uniref:F-box domain-containing protein n=1 Tax=Cryoendolithus antarcticus TaxID=1507870 RepID=A0A1V8TGK9_9PEZI|nr:hypothetical protein B0A48_03816 [Cryoendolithus antarcticus]